MKNDVRIISFRHAKLAEKRQAEQDISQLMGTRYVIVDISNSGEWTIIILYKDTLDA